MSTTGPGGRRAWVVWGAAVAVYFFAIFHRSSLGVAGIMAARAVRHHRRAAVHVHGAAARCVRRDADPGRRAGGPVRSSAAAADRGGADDRGAARVRLHRQLRRRARRPGVRRHGRRDGVHQRAAGGGVLVPGRCATRCSAQLTGMLGQFGALVAAIPLARALATSAGRRRSRPAPSTGVLLGLLVVLLVRDVPPGAPPSRHGQASPPYAGPAAGLARPRHPARALVALHHAVRRNVMGTAVGLPVLRARAGTGRPAAGGAAVAAGRRRSWSAGR